MKARAAVLFLGVTACLDAPPDSSFDGPPPTLLAAFRFESDPGFLVDSSGKGHDALCAGSTCPLPTVARDDSSGAALFDGGDDTVFVDPLSSGPFTIMLWLRLDVDLAPSPACPVSKLFGQAGNSWQLCLPVPLPDTVALNFFTTEEPILLTAQRPMELGTWHHVAMRWDGTEKSLWWDGVEVVTGPGATRFDTGDVLIGGDVDDAVGLAFFPGALDDVEIHDGALGDTEIAAAAGL